MASAVKIKFPSLHASKIAEADQRALKQTVGQQKTSNYKRNKFSDYCMLYCLIILLVLNAQVDLNVISTMEVEVNTL